MAQEGYRNFGAGAAEVAVDKAGNVIGGYRYTVWDAMHGGSQVTDLLDVDGSPLPGEVTSHVSDDEDEGRIFFQARKAYSVLYLDRGVGVRWAVWTQQIGTLVSSAILKSDSVVGAADAAEVTAQEAKDAVHGAVLAVANVQAQQEAFTTTALSVGQTLGTLMIPGEGVVDSNTIWMVFSAPFDCTLVWAEITPSASRSVSPSDYVTLDLQRWSGGVKSGSAVSKATISVQGEKFNKYEPWSFEGAVWNEANAKLNKGDLLMLELRVSGTQTFPLPAILTYRVVPR